MHTSDQPGAADRPQALGRAHRSPDPPVPQIQADEVVEIVGVPHAAQDFDHFHG
jgi:hypothetical protein